MQERKRQRAGISRHVPSTAGKKSAVTVPSPCSGDMAGADEGRSAAQETAREQSGPAIVFKLQFGYDMDISESTLVPASQACLALGIQEALAEKGVDYGKMMSSLIDALGGETLVSDIADELSTRFAASLSRRQVVCYDLGGEKTVDGKFYHPIASMEYGFFKEGKGLVIRGDDDEAAAIVMSMIDDGARSRFVRTLHAYLGLLGHDTEKEEEEE